MIAIQNYSRRYLSGMSDVSLVLLYNLLLARFVMCTVTEIEPLSYEPALVNAVESEIKERKLMEVRNG